MNADERGWKHEELTRQIIGVFYEVYTELGYGFLENVYEAAMEIALTEKSLKVVRQCPIPVSFRGRVIAEYKSDMTVNNLVLVEFKAARDLDPANEAQLLNYLRATPYEVGLLMNFGPKPTVRRFAFENHRKNQADAFSPSTL